MKLLALDTSTDICSIGVADDTGILGEYDFAHRMDLSRRLMPNIIALLKDCGLRVKDLEAIGVSLGPGSFTGLRIGVVTAKTLAQVLEVPIAGIVSLDLLAHQFDYLADTLVCPLVKVRKGEVYYSFYRANAGALERISSYEAGPTDELIECARGLESKEIIFCGDALGVNLCILQERLSGRVVPAPTWLSYPKASILARAALEKVAAGEAADPLSLVPFYVRKSTPEIRLECGSSNVDQPSVSS